MESQVMEAILTEIKCMTQEFANLRKELNDMNERLTELEKNNKKVGDILIKHIGFVDDKYEHYKGSLDYIKDKVNYLNPLKYLYSGKSGYPKIEDSA
jgi:archaellum component FlaC